MNQISSLKSNFPALDKILKGGFPSESLVSINDVPAGSGWLLASSILSKELQRGNYGIVLAFDHSPDLIRKQLKSIGTKVAKYEKEEKLFFVNCFKFAEKTGPLTITNPSSSPEVLRPFREVNRITEGKMRNKTVCVVDSVLSLSTLFSIQHAVSFSLLIREIAIRFGCIVFLLIPNPVEAQCTDMIEYNSDVILEYRIREHEGEEQPMLRVKKLLIAARPSDWIPDDLASKITDRILTQKE
ncbi:MAG: RAD55 family ATPase [Candidatus Hodarchaeota archaeon]